MKEGDIYIHRTLKGDYTIVKSELIADGNLKDEHTGRQVTSMILKQLIKVGELNILKGN